MSFKITNSPQKTIPDSDSETSILVPNDFLQALESLRGISPRPEIHLNEVPAPKRLAPYSLALTAEVNSDTKTIDPDCYLGDGRLVVIYDPAGQPAWGGTFRIIAQLTANLENEVRDDPFLGEVVWSWLTDSFQDSGVGIHHLSGTVTRVLSESFGKIELTGSETEIELRASWTPNSPDIEPHALAWINAMSSICGLSPCIEGVTTLRLKR